MAKPRYRGFSFQNYVRSRTFKTSDIDTIKQDLLNHINTRRGERVNMPLFGTRIPDLVFELLDDITTVAVREELQYVFDYDPRVKVDTLRVVVAPRDYALAVVADLQYLELNVSDQFNFNIEFIR